MASESKEILVDIPPYIKIYKDGTVERLFGSPYVPPSLDPTTNVSSKDVTISSNTSARLYLPSIADPGAKLPILVYFHGGGFCLESAFSALDHRYLNAIVSKANALTISVEYRLAPEHPLPAAFEDCWEALRWVASHAAGNPEFGPTDPWLVSHGGFGKIFLGGDSAGGNIAYNMAMRAGAESLPCGVSIVGAFLSHPYFWDSRFEKGSDDKESDPYRMWMLVYPSAPGGINNPLINPFVDDAPDLSKIGCRKLLVCCSEKDQLREINLRFVEALKKSEWNGEGEVEVVDVEGEDHCFQAFNPYSEKAESLIGRIGSFING